MPPPRSSSCDVGRSPRGNRAAFKRSLLQCIRGAGEILLKSFGRRVNPRRKPDASIVCDADLAAERYILEHLQTHFPGHNLISEERGRTWHGAEYTWVIDPLDGTSNYVAGLPWFGVQMALFHGATPILAGMYLPVEGALYVGQTGRGAARNGRKIQVTQEPNSRNVLCAFGFDPVPAKRERASIELLFQVSAAVRNTRTTNCLVDFCYTADGRLGACINLKTKIWDIAPVAVILPEAGGKLTDLSGKPFHFELDAQSAAREYAVLGANPSIHRALATCTREHRLR
jgi:myo-inositol-1(or 4)-monophosphatase